MHVVLTDSCCDQVYQGLDGNCELDWHCTKVVLSSVAGLPLLQCTATAAVIIASMYLRPTYAWSQCKYQRGCVDLQAACVAAAVLSV